MPLKIPCSLTRRRPSQDCVLLVRGSHLRTLAKRKGFFSDPAEAKVFRFSMVGVMWRLLIEYEYESAGVEGLFADSEWLVGGLEVIDWSLMAVTVRLIDVDRETAEDATFVSFPKECASMVVDSRCVRPIVGSQVARRPFFICRAASRPSTDSRSAPRSMITGSGCSTLWGTNFRPLKWWAFDPRRSTSSGSN